MKDDSNQSMPLAIEQIPVTELVARWGTPLYVYSRAAIEKNWREFDGALARQDHQVCYAVKANSNIAVLNILARLGSGFDIVSQGELERVLAAGGIPQRIVFSGVGKLSQEIERALAVDIGCFNIESAEELKRIHEIAKGLGKIAPIAIRVNPHVDARTHPYISTGLKENKFGVDREEAIGLYQQAAQMPHVKPVGITCHIGSQLTELSPFLAAADKIQQLWLELKEQLGMQLPRVDLGGGLGVHYRSEQPPSPQSYVTALVERLNNPDVKLILEPGRAIVANAGWLITRVEYLKRTAHKNFAVVDAAMNDLLRPALYHAEQPIIPVIPQTDVAKTRYDVVGPVCETADFLGKDRDLALKTGDLLAICAVGAYGFTMSSNYNSRGRAAEVMVDGQQAYLIRRRETLEELFASEQLLPD